jgi:hypothetical protein
MQSLRAAEDETRCPVMVVALVKIEDRPGFVDGQNASRDEECPDSVPQSMQPRGHGEGAGAVYLAGASR